VSILGSFVRKHEWVSGTVQQGPSAWSDWGVASSGVNVTPETAMRLTAVYGCVRLLSDSVAGLPLQTFSKSGDERQPYPADAWLQSPNPEYTRFRLWQEVMTGLLLDGNAFLLLKRSAGGNIIQAWPVWPSTVIVERDDEGYRRYRIGSEFYTDYDMLHIQGLTLPGQLRGLSPIGSYVAQNAVGLGIAAEEYAASVYRNGAMPNGVLLAPSVRDKAQADALKAAWKQAHSGLSNANDIAVLGGDATWQGTSFTPEAAQLVGSRSFQVEEICRIYGVPPHMVASVERSTSWGTGIEQQGIQWVVYSLRPWLERIEQSVTPLLRRPRTVPAAADLFCRFNVEGLLRGDMKSRMEAYQVGINAGIYTPNQCLTWEDLPGYEGGDTHYFPMNFMSTEDDSASMRSKIEAAGVLVRSGFDPAAALSALGLPDIPYTDVQPVTVRPVDSEGVQLAPASPDDE
jgi:HK97 family phage portal protein